MKIINLSILTVLAITASACSNRFSWTLKVKDKPVVSYNNDRTSDSSKSVEKIDIVDSIKMIKLEEDGHSPINVIAQFENLDSVFIVRDLDNAYRFDRNGKFLNQFGKEGTDYKRLDTFMLDSLDHVLLVDGCSKKMLVFNQDGTLIQSREFSSKKHDFINAGTLLQDGSILMNNAIFNLDNNLYTLLKPSETACTDIMHTQLNSKEIAFPMGRHPISNWNGSLRLTNPYDNHFFTLDKNGLPIKDLTIQTALSTPGTDILSKPQNQIDLYSTLRKSSEYFLGYTSIFETENYLILENMYNECFYVDKYDITGDQIKEKDIKYLILPTSGKELIGASDKAFYIADSSHDTIEVFFLKHKESACK